VTGLAASKELTHRWKGLREHLSAIIFTLASSGVQILFLYQMTVAYGDAFPLNPYNLTFTFEIPMLYKGTVPLGFNPFITLIPLGVVVATLAIWMYTVQRTVQASVKPKQLGRKSSRFSISLPRLSLKLGSSLTPSARSGLLILGTFTATLFIPYILTSPIIYPSLRMFHQMLPESLRVPTYEFYAGYVKPLRTLDPVYKFLLSQNLSVLITAFLSLILTRARH